MEKVNYLKINLLNKSRVCFSHRPVCGGETRLWTDLRQLSWFLHLRLQQGIQTERRQEDLLKLVSHTHTHKHAQNTQTRVETVVTADSCWLCVTNCAWIHAEMDSDLRAAQSWFLLLHEAECGSALCSSCCRLNLLNNTSFIFLNVPFKTLNWTQSGCARLFYKNSFKNLNTKSTGLVLIIKSEN